MEDYAQKVCDAINLIDETSFGKIGNLLDKMAYDAQRAAFERLALIRALNDLVLLCGRSGSSLEDFEEQAEVYQKETGHMRPGKDRPMTSDYRDDDPESARLRYAAWVQSKIKDARHVLGDFIPEEGINCGSYRDAAAPSKQES
jgi:hypothetical protein